MPMDIKERIIENSLDLFINRGCKSVTMDDVAAENGISKRTLYENFTDKSTLLEQILLLYEKNMNEMFVVLHKNTANVLESFLQIHEAQNEVVVNLRINFFMELKKFYPQLYTFAVERMIKSHFTIINEGIKRGQQQGLFREDINLEIVAKLMLEMGHLADNSEVFPVRQYPRKELFKELYITYIRGLCTLKGIDIIDNYFNK